MNELLKILSLTHQATSTCIKGGGLRRPTTLNESIIQTCMSGLLHSKFIWVQSLSTKGPVKTTKLVPAV